MKKNSVSSPFPTAVSISNA
uniref:Uncharacterized protein n=1 Tax=Anguilla anguilla TaxID=7936 RepID=A0A0E9QEJ2_ANGAN